MKTLGWTANSNVNYMASIVGIGIYTGTVSFGRIIQISGRLTSSQFARWRY